MRIAFYVDFSHLNTLYFEYIQIISYIPGFLNSIMRKSGWGYIMKSATLLCSLIVSLTLPACNRAGHGLYEQAYQLLSSTAQRPHSLEEYVRNKAKAFRTIKIITIQPYYLLAEKRCSQVKPETGNERRFFVQIIAEGEGSMSGSALSGALQTLFLSLTREGGEWKIDTFATIGMCP